jgi:hypothetical protein
METKLHNWAIFAEFMFGLTPALSKGEGARKGQEFESLIFKVPLFWRGI